MNRLIANLAVVAALFTATFGARTGFAQPPPMAVVSPEVHPDGTVTFRLLAPNAKQVSVQGEFTHTPITMTKNDAGVWSVTVGPLQPNVYGYGFTMDGLNMPDPCNTFVRVGSLAFESQVDVPGKGAEFLAIADVPHGTVHERWYHSRALGVERRVLIYTPPGYESDGAKKYPVLYLLHGMGDDEAFWISVGRANFILDNLFAANRSKPFIVVMPFGHASRNIMSGPRRPRGEPPPAGAPPAAGSSPAPGAPPPPGPMGGMFGVEMLETDLKDNIMPMVERDYRTNKDRGQRAIAGLSMGGYQALTIGLNNPQLFAYVAGFSSALVGGRFETNVQPLLADLQKANADFKLLWLSCGADDSLLAPNQQFEKLLTEKGIKHEWVLTPDYAHWWTLWRVNLRDLAPRLFTP